MGVWSVDGFDGVRVQCCVLMLARVIVMSNNILCTNTVLMVLLCVLVCIGVKCCRCWEYMSVCCGCVCLIVLVETFMFVCAVCM